MVYVGVIPYARDPNTGEHYLLLGKEHAQNDWHDQNKWAHFAGGMEDSDTSLKRASARECYEESMGFLGSLEDIYNQLDDTFCLRYEGVCAYLLPINYDPHLPQIYRNVHEYLTKCAVSHPHKPGYEYLPTCPDGFFEKTAIGWFNTKQLQKLILTGIWDYPSSILLRHGFCQLLRNLFKNFSFP
jgi:hypothetical protein